MYWLKGYIVDSGIDIGQAINVGPGNLAKVFYQLFFWHKKACKKLAKDNGISSTLDAAFWKKLSKIGNL